MNKRSLFTLIIVSVFAAQTLYAASGKWELDKAHSNLYFSVDHIFSKIRGHFNDFSADVRFDPKDPTQGRFYFEVKVDSIDTAIAKRDKHLQSADFFDAAEYETMTFESVSITDVGNQVYEVDGKFTVKGKSYDLVLPLRLVGIKDHPAAKGKEVVGFNGTVTIDRLAYGVGNGKFYKMGVVGKDVEILVSLELLGDK